MEKVINIVIGKKFDWISQIMWGDVADMVAEDFRKDSIALLQNVIEILPQIKFKMQTTN